MYTEWQYQFENRKMRTRISKLVGVPIFATLLSLLAEKQPNTARNESYIIIIQVKLLTTFAAACYTSFEWEKNAEFFWNIRANLIICRGYLSFKCVIADFTWLFHFLFMPYIKKDYI